MKLKPSRFHDVRSSRNGDAGPAQEIAYFCAAELMANVAKHSAARHATLQGAL